MSEQGEKMPDGLTRRSFLASAAAGVALAGCGGQQAGPAAGTSSAASQAAKPKAKPKGRVIILATGTGSPFVTTDTAAVGGLLNLAA